MFLEGSYQNSQERASPEVSQGKEEEMGAGQALHEQRILGRGSWQNLGEMP